VRNHEIARGVRRSANRHWGVNPARGTGDPWRDGVRQIATANFRGHARIDVADAAEASPVRDHYQKVTDVDDAIQRDVAGTGAADGVALKRPHVHAWRSGRKAGPRRPVERKKPPMSPAALSANVQL
jgi:hypothetical protein